MDLVFLEKRRILLIYGSISICYGINIFSVNDTYTSFRKYHWSILNFFINPIQYVCLRMVYKMRSLQLVYLYINKKL